MGAQEHSEMTCYYAIGPLESVPLLVWLGRGWWGEGKGRGAGRGSRGATAWQAGDD